MDSCYSANEAARLECAPILINRLLEYAGSFAVLAAICFLIYAGFQFAMAHGDREKIEGAKQTIRYAITGLIVVILSFVIIRLVANLLGVPSGTFLSIP